MGNREGRCGGHRGQLKSNPSGAPLGNRTHPSEKFQGWGRWWFTSPCYQSSVRAAGREVVNSPHFWLFWKGSPKQRNADGGDWGSRMHQEAK